MSFIKEEVIKFIDDRRKFYNKKGKFMIYWDNKPLFLNDKAKSFYKSEVLAKNAAIQWLYTTEDIIDELIKEGRLKIENV